jgi:hypothetical protein
MDKVTFFVNDFDGVEYAIVDKGDGSFQSMTKEHYEKLQAEQSTPTIEVPE